MRKTDGFAFSHAVQVWERAAWDVEAAVEFCVPASPTKTAYNFARSLSIAARGTDYLELLR